MKKIQPKEQVKQAVREVIQEQRQQPSTTQQQDPEQQKIINHIMNCNNARVVCLQTEVYCLVQGGNLADAKIIKMLHDCIDLCEATANAVVRDSNLKSDLAKLCSKACKEGVKAAEKFKEDQQMQVLSQYLKQCSQSCDEI